MYESPRVARSSSRADPRHRRCDRRRRWASCSARGCRLARRVAERQAAITSAVTSADRRQREQHDVRLAPVARRARGRRHASGERTRRVLLADDEARVVLVDVELAVEAQVLGVGAEEALDVRVRGQQLEALVLERAQVLAADLGRRARRPRTRCAGAGGPRGGCCRSRTRRLAMRSGSLAAATSPSPAPEAACSARTA